VGVCVEDGVVDGDCEYDGGEDCDGDAPNDKVVVGDGVWLDVSETVTLAVGLCVAEKLVVDEGEFDGVVDDDAPGERLGVGDGDEVGVIVGDIDGDGVLELVFDADGENEVVELGD